MYGCASNIYVDILYKFIYLFCLCMYFLIEYSLSLIVHTLDRNLKVKQRNMLLYLKCLYFKFHFCMFDVQILSS
jgi:hypothetical protein